MEIKKSPDGGWGWVIVLVSFFTQFLCYGSPVAVGVLYVEWLDAFGEGKGKTAWVGSLASGVGLLASMWINMFLFTHESFNYICCIVNTVRGIRGCLYLKYNTYFPAFIEIIQPYFYCKKSI